MSNVLPQDTKSGLFLASTEIALVTQNLWNIETLLLLGSLSSVEMKCALQ